MATFIQSRLRMATAICVVAMLPTTVFAGGFDPMRALNQAAQVAKAANAGNQQNNQQYGQQYGQQYAAPQASQSPSQGSSKTKKCVQGAAIVGGLDIAKQVFFPGKQANGKKKNINVGEAAVAAGVGCLGALAFSSFSDRDNAAVETHAQAAADATTPQDVSFRAPDSGQQVEVKTYAPEAADNKEVEVRYDDGVQKPSSGFQVEAATYVVNVDRLNLRSSPRVSDNNVVGFFDKGDRVEVMGRTPDGQWAILGDNGVVVGYSAFTASSGALLVSEEDAARQARADAQRKQARKVAQASAARAHLKVYNASGTTSVRVADASKEHTDKVMASTQCKAVEARTGQQVKNTTSCQNPDGHYLL